MSSREQFRSLTLELEALRDRVRNFRQTKNWQTDGEWKELVLRSVLERHLPRHLEPLRGFVTDGVDSTRQIDVLICDNTKPVLFRSGDLVFVTPDAVAGIIEVKSTIRQPHSLKLALKPLASNIEKIRRWGNREAFSGLFAFDTDLGKVERLGDILDCLQETSGGREDRIVDLVSLGSDTFVLYWDGGDSEGQVPSAKRWHAHVLQGLSPGYFVNNVVYNSASASVQQHIEAWFPHRATKELAFETSQPSLKPSKHGDYGVIHPGPKSAGR